MTDDRPPDPVPHWRTVGTVTLTGPADLHLGDPTIAIESLDVTLDAGDWRWEVRDANPAGTPTDRPWEVRLRRVEVPAADTWDWVDAYTRPNTHPAPAATLAGTHSVDASTLAWLVVPRDDPNHDPGTLLDDVRTGTLLELADNGPTYGGHVLVTSTGGGDGVYQSYVRTDAGDRVVEIRICYLAPDPAALDAATFTALLPGAFTDVGDVTGATVTVHLHRTHYVARRLDDPDRLAERCYDNVTGLTLTSPDGHQTRLHDHRRRTDGPGHRYAGDTLDRIRSLWARLTPTAADQVTTHMHATEPVDRPDLTGGLIVVHTTRTVDRTLTHTL